MLDKFKALFSSRKPQYKCSCCGKTHEDRPAIAYDAPDSYYGLDDQQRRSSEISSDFCVIAYPDGQIDRSIRAVLALEVRGQCQNLDYGVWVSLSEKSFEDHKANFNNEDHEAIYFGWLCSSIEGYESTFNVPTDVICNPGGSRPKVRPHPDHDHPFVKDYYNAISLAEAEKRIAAVIQRSGGL